MLAVRKMRMRPCINSVKVKKTRPLYRAIEVALPEDVYTVAYSGWGLGFETVYVNRKIACRTRNWTLWFISQFDFAIGSHAAVIKVHIWPWLQMRSFSLQIDGQLAYSEAISYGF